MRHSTVPIFVPFAGCPQRCIYCDQRAIAASCQQPDAAQVTALLQQACRQKAGFSERPQVAFFGGSFTAIDRSDMTSLLEAVQPFLNDGSFDSVRISTRPDAIDEQTLRLLKRYGVKTVELGAQSTDDEVLKLNRRGHTFADVCKASELVKSFGFELVLQMMTGLYGANALCDLKSARDLLALKPDAMRVYPTVVLEGTELAALWRKGEYLSPSLEETVTLCAHIKKEADEAGVPIIRMGLHSELSAQTQPLAGPYHPAFGELVESRIYLERLQELLLGKEPGTYTVYAAQGRASAVAGHRKCNRKLLSASGYDIVIRCDASLDGYAVAIEKESDKCF